MNQFYASLYTHAVAWALDGKTEAKRLRHKTPSDALDKALRNVTDGQTMGVPIGPDTSFLAAEILLASVDRSLAETIELRGHRYLDDYELAFSSRSAAEEALAVVEDTLADYELTVNQAKTQILELPQPFDDLWTHELSRFDIRDDPNKPSQTVTDLIALFGRAAEIARVRPGVGAIKYALLRARSIEGIDDRVWGPFQNLIWSAVSAEPTTMPTALDLLSTHTSRGDLEVDVDAAAEVIEGLIHEHSPVRNASEVAWALWAAIVLDVEMSSGSAALVASSEDDFVALLAMSADEADLFPESINRDGWERLVDGDDVMSASHWLLAYEASERGWLKAAAPRVAKDQFFRKLAQREVRFYKTDPDHSPFTGPAGPLPGGLVPDEYI